MASDVVFSFDTTGSMSPCIADVRANVEKLCANLFKDLPGLRIGVIAHGDYIDGDRCISLLPLTNDVAVIHKFFLETPNTGGGDAPECYELALHKGRTMDWRPEAHKLFILIGDDQPHKPTYPGNTLQLDWKQELAGLKEIGVKVYPLKCLNCATDFFYQYIADLFETPLLRPTNFAGASEILAGYVYASGGEEAFAGYEANVSDVAAPFAEALRDESRKYGV